MRSSDRTLIAAFKEISQMADRINLPLCIVLTIQECKSLRFYLNSTKYTYGYFCFDHLPSVHLNTLGAKRARDSLS